MQNPDVARLLDEVADLLEIDGANTFRVRAYRTAARTVRDLSQPVADLVRQGSDLTELPGIGTDLAEKIATIVKSGSLPLHRQLTRKVPGGLLDLLRIPGLGPKRVSQLHSRLHVRNAAALRKALDAGSLDRLKGFGPKIIAGIRDGLGAAEHVEHRLLLTEAEASADPLVHYLERVPGVTRVAVAGSYRRRKETVGDLDVLVTAKDPARAIEPGLDPRHRAALRRNPGRSSRRPSGVLRRGPPVFHRIQGAQPRAPGPGPGPSPQAERIRPVPG